MTKKGQKKKSESGLQLLGAARCTSRLRAHPALVIEELAHGVDLRVGHSAGQNFRAFEPPAGTGAGCRGPRT